MEYECRSADLAHHSHNAAAAATALFVAPAAPNEDDVAQHRHAKEMLQLTEWMAAVGQGDKEMLVGMHHTAHAHITALALLQPWCSACMLSAPKQQLIVCWPGARVHSSSGADVSQAAGAAVLLAVR